MARFTSATARAGLVAAAVSIGVVGCGASAYAHMLDPGRSYFDNGMMHTLTAYEQLAPLVGLGVAIGRARQAIAVSVAFVAAAVCGYFMMGDAPYIHALELGPAMFLASGLALIVGAAANGWAMVPCVGAAGLATGMLLLADGPDDDQALVFSAAAGLAMLLIVAIAALASRRLPWGWVGIAVRIGGSWLVAIGIMLGAVVIMHEPKPIELDVEPGAPPGAAEWRQP